MKSYTAEYEPEVFDDIERHGGYYADIDPELRVDFIVAAQAALARVVQRPETFPPAGFAFLRPQLKRFPFCVFFRVTGTVVRVVGLFHDRQDPKAWQSRARNR